MKRVSNWYLILGLMVNVMVAGTTLASSDADYADLKLKISNYQALTQADVDRAEQMNVSGQSSFDMREVWRLFKEGGGAPATRPRRPHPTLDEYQYSTTTYNWFDISTLGTEHLLMDDAAVVLDLPFDFTFYDVNYNSMSLGANGYVVLGGTDTWSQTWGFDPIPTEWDPNNFIAMFWRDLNSNSGTAGHVYTYHDAANSRFVIEFDAVEHFGENGFPETFQCFLYSNGNIVIQYNVVSDATGVLVGIENQDGTDGVQVCFEGGGDCPTNGLAILINQPDGFPNPVTNVTATLVGANVNLAWTNPTQDTNGNPVTLDAIQVWLGQPGVGMLLATLGGTVQAYTHVNAPDGNLTYYVRAYNDPYYGAAGSVNIVVGDPSYMEGFEMTDGLWVSDNPDGWQRGTPTDMNGPDAAHGGDNCWGTVLAGNYPNDACFNLILDPELAVVSAGATVEFWAWYDAENGWDGCNFNVSIDGGVTWEIVDPLSGYPGMVNEWNECMPSQIVWNGSAQRFWEYIVIPIGQYIGQVPQYRFTFGSDPAVNGYPGFFFDDMLIWGLADPVGANVSGTVSLDGGAGNVVNAVVHADGLGNPNTHPAANGTYTLTDVLVGNRVVWATLANYVTESTNVTLTEAGLTNVNLILERVPPPAPTGLTGVVDQETGIVTLNWDNSTDPLVDGYYVYRRYEGDTNWINSQTIAVSQTTYQLPTVGVFEIAVVAFDNNASHPIVSAPSPYVRILYGEIPPTGLVYTGDRDNTISLYWFEPGTLPAVELSYDNGVNSLEWGGVGWDLWDVPPTFGWITSRFEGNGEVAITKARIYFNAVATAGDPFQVGIFADDGFGMPTFEPLVVVDAVHEAPFDRFRDFDFIPPVAIPEGVFHIGTRQMTIRNVAIGGDIQTPFITSTFFWNLDGSQWTEFNPWNLSIPMQRCIAVGDFGQEIELSPSPVDVPIREWISEWERTDRFTRENDATSRTVRGFMVQPSREHPFMAQMSISELLERARTAVAPHAPTVTIPTADRRPSGTLDDVDYYIVYRDAIDIAHPTDEEFDDAGRPENISYHYYVTAHYENGEESGPSPAVDAMCNMEPMPPTNLLGVAEGDTGIRLTWTDPTMNRDSSALVDLTTIYVYRDGVLAGTAAAGAQQYIDIPPAGEGTYIWSLKAADEIPNISEESMGYFGAVGNPSYANGFEFDDGLWVPVSGWERGMPTQQGAPLPHTGENCWATGLNTEYPSNSCWQLDMDIGLAIAEADAALEFWGAWDSEGDWTPWDGCNFKISTDGGETWEIVQPETPYTFEFAQTDNACMSGQPVWTGYAHDWEYITLPLGQYMGEAPIFRFEFGSDPIINGAGFFIDDMIIWGLAEPVTATVTGTVALDGGVGNVQNVAVRADGLGTPLTNPAANGSYTLDGVLVGNRRVRGMLAGYNTALTQVTVTEAGPNVANLTLVRVNPPTPTGLTGTVANATGVVTLNWDDSTDPLVDQYRVYRRVHPTTDWVLAQTSPTSNATDVLTLDGIWDYTVTAVDVNVSTPVVSGYATPITVLYGSLPPTNLSANGNFDNKIVLNWLEPGNELGHEISYDDDTAEGFITLHEFNGPQDQLAVRFTPPPATEILYPIEINALAVYLADNSNIQLIMVCPDNWGTPMYWAPLMSWNNVSAEASPGWLMIETEGALVLENEADFWVVIQLPSGQQGPGVGGDNSEPDGRSSWFTQDQWTWFADFDWDYMMRVWVLGNGGGVPTLGQDAYLLSAGNTDGYRIDEIPHIVLQDASKTQDSKQLTNTKSGSKSPAPGNKTSSMQTSESFKTGKSAPAVSVKAARNDDRQPFVRVPELQLQSRNRRPSSLDDVDYYVVYRTGTDIGHPTATSFEDLNRIENVVHSYTVTAHYDDNTQSPPVGPVNRACNMAPAAPFNLQGTPIGMTQMHLTWSNPTTNADGTTLVDHDSTRIYRSGTRIATVDNLVTTYNDTPPENDQLYSWTVRAADEVPNISADSEPFASYVVPPWQEEDFDWQDISDAGTPIMLSDDSQIMIEIPFSFPFFGQTFTTAQLSSNGYLAFGESPWSQNWNEPIPSPNTPNGIIAMFWDDLNPGAGGQIYTWGSPQNDIFIIQFQDVPHWNIGGNETFQLIIDEDGGILLQYQAVTDPSSCTVGAESIDGSTGVQLCYDQTGLFCPETELAVSLWRGPSGEIHGQVREFGTNLAIPGCEISVAGLPDVVLTDNSGNYIFGVDPGTYTLTMHKQSYCDLVFPGIVVNDGSSILRNGSMFWPNGQFTVTSFNILTGPGLNREVEFEIRNPSAGCQFEFSITADEPWLSFSPEEGEVMPDAVQLITVTANVGGLAAGEYIGVITIDHNDDDSPYTIPVHLIISEDADNPESLPTAYAFNQNYPNPFNATTVFGFELPAESRVELVIFNVMGQEVARPVMADYPAGRYEISYTADLLPSGMYIVRMTAGEFTGLQKIVLLK